MFRLFNLLNGTLSFTSEVSNTRHKPSSTLVGLQLTIGESLACAAVEIANLSNIRGTELVSLTHGST